MVIEVHVWNALSGVHDPEIPPCSITDLGIVERVDLSDGEIQIDLLPTFVGCPALDAIREDVEEAVGAVADGRTVRVRFVYAPPWTSDRITEQGRRAMNAYGLTPPGDRATQATFIPLASLQNQTSAATCPFCGSQQTVLESAFGPTLCRSVHFCHACRNPFEAFKQKTPTG
jgi:ring-1,2-phenylacetyl-CoA epoxidase subunit PaaD